MAGESKYHGIDHAVLISMVDKTQPDMVLKRANQLENAGRVLTDLSSALQAHLGQVTWEGPAAENFKTWVGNLYKSAAIIGQHSTTAGGAMTQAGEALSTAKAAMPPLPATAIQKLDQHAQQKPYPGAEAKLAVGQSVDDYMKAQLQDKWVTDAEATKFKAAVDKEHQEAVKQVENLAQAYSAATTTLNGIPDDVRLPGTPDTAAPDKSGNTDYTGGGSGGGYGAPLRSPRSSGGSVGGSYSSPVGSYRSGSVTPRDPGTTWQDPSNPGHTGPTPPHGGGPVPSTPQDPGSSTPPSHPSDPIDRPGTGLDSLPPAPTLPGQAGPGPLSPSGPGATPVFPGGPDGPGGTPGMPGGGPITGFPGGIGGGSIPVKGSSGGYVPGKGGGSIPPRPAPFGGGQIPGKSGSPGLPSGTVFGSREAGPAGGRAGSSTGMGGMHPGMGGGHGIGGSGGGARGGRGLTSTGGGTVGGRKGPAVGGEFTPGGTGLRNRAAAAGAAEGGARSGQNGMMGPGMAGHGGRNERDRRKRADYLHEDEETWTSGTPHSNPDVVE
ncbi:WXG100 family type VII secretion target [Kitasatospora sp. SUK 42]|uniref:WXG100 family type VII secretion target n=1 Tax=Kitasatospora sp. SUK 42 TaxID=1588882 RepID=UPI0018CB4694|nr:hypothetical protein [Kitasatospora sp. SUK 42]MBV2152320.1 hypothetical protein [Kitasatospora sp. SUK 42]